MPKRTALGLCLLTLLLVVCISPLLAAPDITLRTSQVTYWDLSPKVELEASVPGIQFGSSVEFRITDPLSGKVLAHGTDKTNDKGIASLTLRVKAPETMGLLAIAEVRMRDRVLKGMRPFDVSNDPRRNFRYGTTAFGTISIAPGHNYPWPRMAGATPTKEESFQSAYDCYQNVLNMLIKNDRGHWTCWEEYGGKSWPYILYTSDAGTIYYDRLKWLCDECNKAGILPQTHVAFQHYGTAIMKEQHPWITTDKDGKPKLHEAYRTWYMKRDDPDWNHPLTKDEQALMDADVHGATNWLQFVLNELDTTQRKFNLGSFWLDNGCTFDVSAPYMMSELRWIIKARRPNFVFMTNWYGGSWPYPSTADYSPATPQSLDNTSGNNGWTDVIWTEEEAQGTMDKMLPHMREIMNRPRDPGVTVYWAGNHPVTDGMTLADVNNRANCTFLYRQFLFELISMDADLVGAGNEPRRHDVRWVRFRDAYRDHAHTWGFQTLYTQLFNAPDICQVDAAPLVSVTDTAASYDNAPKADTVHVRLTQRTSSGRLMVHLFNYLGTTLETVTERPHPRKCDALNLRIRVPGPGKYVVKVVSPDFSAFDDVRSQTIEASGNRKLSVTVPFDTYTLVVIERAAR